MNAQLKTTLTMLAADREKIKLLFAEFDQISRRAKAGIARGAIGALPLAVPPTAVLCIEDGRPSK